MPPHIMDLLQSWASLLPSGLSVLICGYVWRMARRERLMSEERAQALENEIAARLDRIEMQHGALEAQIRALPTLKDFSPIYDRINAVDAMLHRLIGQVDGIDHHRDMMLQHHLRD